MSVNNGGDGPNRPTSFDFGLGAPTGQADSAGAPLVSRKETRRRAALDTRSLAIPIIVTVLVLAVLAGAGITAWTLVQSSEAEVKQASALFCADLAKTPGVLEQPGFGWPTEVADLPTSLAAMRAYQSRWEKLASVAPPTIKKEVKAIADAGKTIADGVETSKSIDRPGSLASITTVTSATVIPSWTTKYCG